MQYLPQVKVTKEDFLALSDLAGEMSIMDYMSKVIHEHVAAQQSVHPTNGGLCAVCNKPANCHEDHDYVAPLSAISG